MPADPQSQIKDLMVPFVGRQSELAVLRNRLSEAVAGHPQVVLIEGPAGIGKTALIEHFLAFPEVEPRPVVIWASGEETEELLAYGVLEQLARSAAAVGSSTVSVPPAPLLSGSDDGPVEDPVTVGTRLLELFDSLAKPAVIVAVDDVQWTDRPSLQALIFALRRLVADQVLTVVAVRSENVADLPESLSRLVRRQSGTGLRLGGLDQNELTELAAALGIAGIDPPAARRLQYGTQGNPLHARALLEEFPLEQWGSDDELLPPPRSFRRLVEDRYAACSEPAQRLVDAAAVLGPHSLLPVAAGLAEVADALEALDEATAHDLLRPAGPGSPWAVSFTHPLTRAAVYDALSPARRHGLHRNAASMMPDQASALRHRVAAATERDEQLATDLTRFADLEAARQDWQSAAAHLVEASRLSPDPAAAQRRVLQAVVWTMIRGDAVTAAGFSAEIESYPGGPLRDVVLGSLAMADDNPAAAEPLFERAWAACGPAEDPEIRATVALMAAIHWYGRLDAPATVLWCERALALVSSDSSLRPVAETYLVHGLGYAGRAADSAAAAASAAEQPGDLAHRWLNPRSARGVLRLVEDDLHGARADLASVAAAAFKLGTYNTAAFSFGYLARAEWAAGAWDDAVLHADRAVAITLESDFDFMQLAVLGIAVLVPAGRGEWDTAQGYLQLMTEHEVRYERSVVALAMARSRIGEASGQPAAVLAALEPVRSFVRRNAIDEPGFWLWQDLYADALVATGQLVEAAAFLLPHEELAHTRGRRLAIARLARARGKLEAALGHTDLAVAAYQHALSATDGLTVPFERGRIELAAGAFLRRSGQRRRAADLLGTARQRFLALGAMPYVERCELELASAGVAGYRLSSGGRAGLTSQELVVARLAAAGRSNRQLADELVVSVKTIEYHLRNAFTKLGVTSRRNLADKLSDLGDLQS